MSNNAAIALYELTRANNSSGCWHPSVTEALEQLSSKRDGAVRRVSREEYNAHDACTRYNGYWQAACIVGCESEAMVQQDKQHGGWLQLRLPEKQLATVLAPTVQVAAAVIALKFTWGVVRGLGAQRVACLRPLQRSNC
jgi:hypothetical protein